MEWVRMCSRLCVRWKMIHIQNRMYEPITMCEATIWLWMTKRNFLFIVCCLQKLPNVRYILVSLDHLVALIYVWNSYWRINDINTLCNRKLTWSFEEQYEYKKKMIAKLVHIFIYRVQYSKIFCHHILFIFIISKMKR